MWVVHCPESSGDCQIDSNGFVKASCTGLSLLKSTATHPKLKTEHVGEARPIVSPAPMSILTAKYETRTPGSNPITKVECMPAVTDATSTRGVVLSQVMIGKSSSVGTDLYSYLSV